jgi:hypothetical protein
MSILTLSNNPVTFKIGDISVNVKKLSISALMAHAQARAISNEIKKNQEIVLSLPKEDRMQLIKELKKELPEGEELWKAGNKWLATLEGLIYMLKTAIQEDITEDEIMDLFTNHTSDIEAIIEYITPSASLEKDDKKK